MVLAGRLSRPSPQVRKLLDTLEAEEGDRILVRVVKTAKARQVQHRLNPAESDQLIKAYQSGLPVRRLTELTSATAPRCWSI